MYIGFQSTWGVGFSFVCYFYGVWGGGGWGLENSPHDGMWLSDEFIQQKLTIYNGLDANLGPGD